MELSLITVPYDSGIRDVRMGCGPDHLLANGLAGDLESLGHRTRTTTIELPTDDLRSEIQTAMEIATVLSGLVADDVREGRLPIVLAGCCYSSIGTLAGLYDADPGSVGVLWFDTHADYNTPDTTASGFLDGMALSMLTGQNWRQLTSSVPGFRAVSPGLVGLLAARDIDELEGELLEASGIRVLPPGDITSGERFDALLSSLSADVERAYLHLDLDLLDPAEGRANQLAAPGGLTVDQACGAVARIGRAIRLAAVAVTAYDPALDGDGRVARAALRLLETALSSEA